MFCRLSCLAHCFFPILDTHCTHRFIVVLLRLYCTLPFPVAIRFASAEDRVAKLTRETCCPQCFEIPQHRRLTFSSLAVSLRTPRVNITKILHGARFALSVFYGYQNRQRPLLYTSSVVESVYSAVRTDSLYKADYASSLKC